MSRLLHSYCVFLLVATVALAQGVSGIPSVAGPGRATAPSVVLVDTIPATAKFVLYLKLNPKHPTMTADEAAGTGKNLAPVIPQLKQAAIQRGANLVVLLGGEHGISVPVSGLSRPIILRPDNPAIMALLFRWDGAPSPTDFEKGIRFTTAPVPPNLDLSGQVTKITYTIGLKSAPANADLSMWVYMNISRFVADAVRHEFDTVALHSTNDPSFEAVWLPGCDEPLKVSKAQPSLEVTIFKAPAATSK